MMICADRTLTPLPDRWHFKVRLTEPDEICIKHDEFCIQNDAFCKEVDALGNPGGDAPE